VKPVFVINPLSETVAQKGSSLKSFSHIAQDVYDEEIFDYLDDIVTAGVKAGWVIIEGGDGTAQGIITAFFNSIKTPSDMPSFTLLPGGMTNQVAKNIGLKTVTKRGIKALLDSPQKQTPMPLLKVTSAGHPDLFGFLFSTGGVPMVTQYTKEKLHSRGIGGSAAVMGGILKGILSRDQDVLRPTDICLNIGNMQHKGSHLGTLVTTLPSLLLGLDPFWGDGEGPLRITYAADNAKRLPVHIAGLWIGVKSKDRSPDGLHSYNSDSLEYDYSGPIVLDGEPLAIGRKFLISATQALNFYHD